MIIPIFERAQIASYARMAGSSEEKHSGGISSGAGRYGGYAGGGARCDRTGHRGVEVFVFGGVRQARPNRALRDGPPRAGSCAGEDSSILQGLSSIISGIRRITNIIKCVDDRISGGNG